MESSMTSCDRALTFEDYARAERLLPGNVKKLAFRLGIAPQWLGQSGQLVYSVNTRHGRQYVLVNSKAGLKSPAFDHVALAAALTHAIGRAFTHDHLPFEKASFSQDGESVEFSCDGYTWSYQTTTDELTKLSPVSPNNSGEVTSPDKAQAAFVKDHNLFVRTGGGQEVQLTSDGSADFFYAEPFGSPIVAAGLLKGPVAANFQRPAIKWSPDSKQILTYRINAEKAKQYHLLQSVPLDGSIRPKLYSYVHGGPGDDECALAYPVIIDVASGAQIPLEIEPQEHLYYGAPGTWTYWTKGDDPRIIWLKSMRERRSFQVLEVDPKTGNTKVLFEESTPHNQGLSPVKVLGDGQEILWMSQRDGWMHLYLYDGKTGALKNRVTSGPFVVRDIEWVDEKNRVVYFTACGKEEGRDPYYRHLYSVNLDGSDMKLLTPEDAEHAVSISPCGEFFVDTYSRVDLAPKTVLRKTDGALVLVLEEADIELLLATGWIFPEPFKAKARDGITDIYGVIFRPSSFDSKKSYPVIEGNYAGPQRIRTPKAFGDNGSNEFWQDQAIAELGFIVVTVDGFGMAYRSLPFQDYAFKNLGDGGFPDHITAYRQLADRYPYMDLNRVGIYGGSAGGYGAARALLAHPDFYKVGVAWAGNHDHRIGKAGWVERYMGRHLGPHYAEQSNWVQAKNLVGKLLIMHGEMDENVSPAASLRLANELIEANIDFDFLLIPNGVHGSARTHPYVVRRRWDYFVRNLLGLEPPKGYRIDVSGLR